MDNVHCRYAVDKHIISMEINIINIFFHSF